MQQDLRDIYDEANRNNVSLYPVDPRGLAVFEFDLSEPSVGNDTDRQYLNATMDSLRTLAENTDGRAIVNRNDLATGMKQIIRDSSAYYLLGYSSTAAPSDGKFHEIKVRVKRPGLQVRARKGYWALTAEETSRALAPPKPGPPPAVTAALSNVASATTRARVIRTWVGTSRGDNGKTRVTFVWEPTPRTAADRPLGPGEAPSRVSVMAVGSSGSPIFRGRVPDMAVASTTPSLSGGGDQNGRASRVVFDAAPGKMELRLSVEGGSGVLDTEIREITVAGFDDDADVPGHAGIVPCTDAARHPAVESRSPGRSGDRARVQPHGSPVHARCRVRRWCAGAFCPHAQQGRADDVRTAGHTSSGPG